MLTTNRVGGKRSSFLPTFVFRPLTPPYVPFGIRRFLFFDSIRSKNPSSTGSLPTLVMYWGLPVVISHCQRFANNLYESYPIDGLAIWLYHILLGLQPGSWGSSKLSIYTYGFYDEAIRRSLSYQINESNLPIL